MRRRTSADEKSDNEADKTSPDDSQPEEETREEYTARLTKWLDEARLWHSFCAGLPYYVSLQNHNANVNTLLNNYWSELRRQENAPRHGPRPVRPERPVSPVAEDAGSDVFHENLTYEFKIPSIWKRLTAEFLDFLILIVIKMIIVGIVNIVYYRTVENYKFDSFKKHITDPKIAMQMSLEILTLEFLHRVIVCVYEVYWLTSSMCATPGKRYMGMIVVRVGTVVGVPGTNDSIVRCTHVCRPDVPKAMTRTVLKNVLLGIMLPICFALYIFRFNRTGYDAISNCLVVECNLNVPPQPVQ